jgi:hypothetical protein
MVRKGSSDASIREAPIETTAPVAQSDTVDLFAAHARSSSIAGTRWTKTRMLAFGRNRQCGICTDGAVALAASADLI